MKTFKIIVSLIFFSILFSACENIDEVPPRTEGYASKTFIVPSPSVLSVQERNEVTSLQDEYDNAIK